jgi:amino acid permease
MWSIKKSRNALGSRVVELFTRGVQTKAGFGWQRVLVRAAVMFTELFVALSIPKFGAILSFIGGLTVNLCTFILPSVFYVQLKRKLHQQQSRCAIYNFHSHTF